ncbi:hypothetical protein C8A00DRAFT_12813 [Chaetomidium leptoderma]|uniref:Protein kinase domain-containing protein n=1 Tax=Chaetomidium leptoderma TaxID=669021 RepID=A0AAN7A0X8_9PEZI|nr:hypothetical protein C8A00DRAFT_12813 [Chaetomidium leptoderma]
MAQPHADSAVSASAPVTDTNNQMQRGLWHRIFSSRDKHNGINGLPEPAHKGPGLDQQGDTKAGIVRRVSRDVVPGLPRTQTFKRQRSEVRSRLEPVNPTPAERRTVSMDRRVHESNIALNCSDPRASAPEFLHNSLSGPSSPSFPMSPVVGMLDSAVDLHALDDLDDRDSADDDFDYDADALSKMDVRSMTTSQYGALIDIELERKWILNLSMHFRDKSKREKFFVTFRQHEHHWRRVTVSLDYRNAPENSLEAELSHIDYQRDKSAKMYEAIRDSLAEIDFYNTVTNLKLETRDGRLHVHVVEDVNEIISYPPVRMIEHMNCRRVRERDIHFDSHMSGFVYKVRVHGRLLIKKEIPGPDNVDEFLYEINALTQLYDAQNVIQFYGIVVDDREENITGLLISYAPRGALIDVIYDSNHSLPWPTRAKWARQIVGGLSEIHEAGFVQGDFTLSNMVIDENDDAKIIDINRRGCPIGWEPPEVTPLVESNQRISMYIGVKSDLYQLGMVLWALATQEDEPDAYGRPLIIEPDVQVPAWYRRIVDTCLSTDPRKRVQAAQLLSWFPEFEEGSQYGYPNEHPMSVDGDGNSRHDYLSPNGIPRIKTIPPPSDWQYVGWGNHHLAEESFYYPSRGRSPPSPMPSNQGDYDPARYGHQMYTWSDTYNRVPPVPSVSDVLARASRGGSEPRPESSEDTLETYADGHYRSRGTTTETSRDDESFADRGRSRSTRDYYDEVTVPAEDIMETTTWGPVPKPWLVVRETHPPETNDDDNDISKQGLGDRGKTGPGSRADSGKDVTEPASTPRDHHRGQFTTGSRQRSVSRGRSGRSSAESAWRRNGQQQQTAIPTTTMDESTYELAHGSYHGHREYGGESDPPADSNDELTQDHDNNNNNNSEYHPPWQIQYRPHADFAQVDDLRGVGSIYDSAALHSGSDSNSNKNDDDGHDNYDEKRQHPEIIIDEDHLGAELDQGLRETAPAARAVDANVLAAVGG